MGNTTAKRASILNWWYRDSGKRGEDIAQYINEHLAKNATLVCTTSVPLIEGTRTYYMDGKVIEASCSSSDHSTGLKIFAKTASECRKTLDQLLAIAENKEKSKEGYSPGRISRRGGYDTPKYWKKYS